MNYTNRWFSGREETRKRRLEALVLIKKQFKNSKEYTKIDELIELYMESHDLVTTVGIEIAKLVDSKEEKTKGC